jgi:formylglycine-generating enzyme required for sulfatase activity
VAPLLVGEVLSRLQLNRLGVPEELLANSGVRPAGIGAAVRGLTARGWRAPSEAEWEFVARAAADSLDDVAPPTTPADRLLSELGNTPELCRDSWHPTWEGAPHDASPWGDGHEVTRGGGHGTRYTGWTASPAWTECVWPSRSQIASSPRPVRVRPVVGLPRE